MLAVLAVLAVHAGKRLQSPSARQRDTKEAPKRHQRGTREAAKGVVRRFGSHNLQRYSKGTCQASARRRSGNRLVVFAQRARGGSSWQQREGSERASGLLRLGVCQCVGGSRLEHYQRHID